VRRPGKVLPTAYLSELLPQGREQMDSDVQ